MSEHQQHNILHLTIIVNGTPESKQYNKNEKVEEVIKSLLPEGQKQNWNQYVLSERSPPRQLDSSKSLSENNVKDNDVLAFTKKDGGGGHN